MQPRRITVLDKCADVLMDVCVCARTPPCHFCRFMIAKLVQLKYVFDGKSINTVRLWREDERSARITHREVAAVAAGTAFGSQDHTFDFMTSLSVRLY